MKRKVNWRAIFQALVAMLAGYLGGSVDGVDFGGVNIPKIDLKPTA